MQRLHETRERGPADLVPDPATRRQQLRVKASQALWELDAVYDLLRGEVGHDNGQTRLLDARYTAARALLLEVLGDYGPPGDPHGAWADLRSEGALLGLLVRGHGWAHVEPGLIRRVGRA